MSDNYTPKQVEKRVSESTLITAQAYSGLVIGTYLTMHLFCIASGNFGPSYFNHFVNVFREIYQNPFFEIPMILAIPIHIISGKMRIDRRHERESGTIRSESEPITFQENQITWHRRSAKFLTFAIVGHFLGTRVFSMVSGILHSFSTLQFTMSYPYGIFFIPYYCILGAAGAYHAINGLYYAFRNLGHRRLLPSHADRIFYYSGITVGIVAVGAVMSFAGFTGFKDHSSFAKIHEFAYGTPKFAVKELK